MTFHVAYPSLVGMGAVAVALTGDGLFGITLAIVALTFAVLSLHVPLNAGDGDV